MASVLPVPGGSIAASSSNDLALAAAAGDRDALAALYEHWSDRVYRWVLLSTRGGHHPAEDICSDVWLKVARSIRNFKITKAGGGFAAWLRTVVRSCVMDAYRRAGRRPEVPTGSMLSIPDVLTYDQDPTELELSQEVVDALRAMPARRREVVLLRHFAGLSAEEVASALGMTENAVRSSLCRGRRDLRKALGPFVAHNYPDLLRQASASERSSTEEVPSPARCDQ